MFDTNILKRTLSGAAAFALGLATASFAGATDLVRADGALLDKQWAEYEADRPKSIREIQPFRRAAQTRLPGGMEVRLTSLNPRFNTWFLLDIRPRAGYDTSTYHLEVADPDATTVSLREGETPALIFERDGAVERCTPWEGRRPDLARAKSSGLPYAPICDKRAFVRNEVRGSRTSREAVAEFLRDNVVFGESIVNMIKGSFYEDAYMSSGEVIAGGDTGEVAESLGRARLSAHPVFRAYFGFDLKGAEGGMQAGSWYAVKDAPGIYASAMQPGMIHPRYPQRAGPHAQAWRGRTAAPMSTSSPSTCPGSSWATSRAPITRALAGRRGRRVGRNPRLPGPDGFDSAEPLVRTGMLSPA